MDSTRRRKLAREEAEARASSDDQSWGAWAGSFLSSSSSSTSSAEAGLGFGDDLTESGEQKASVGGVEWTDKDMANLYKFANYDPKSAGAEGAVGNGDGRGDDKDEKEAAFLAVDFHLRNAFVELAEGIPAETHARRLRRRRQRLQRLQRSAASKREELRRERERKVGRGRDVVVEEEDDDNVSHLSGDRWDEIDGDGGERGHARSDSQRGIELSSLSGDARTDGRRRRRQQQRQQRGSTPSDGIGIFDDLQDAFETGWGSTPRQAQTPRGTTQGSVQIAGMDVPLSGGGGGSDGSKGGENNRGGLRGPRQGSLMSALSATSIASQLSFSGFEDAMGVSIASGGTGWFRFLFVSFRFSFLICCVSFRVLKRDV